MQGFSPFICGQYSKRKRDCDSAPIKKICVLPEPDQILNGKKKICAYYSVAYEKWNIFYALALISVHLKNALLAHCRHGVAKSSC